MTLLKICFWACLLSWGSPAYWFHWGFFDTWTWLTSSHWLFYYLCLYSRPILQVIRTLLGTLQAAIISLFRFFILFGICSSKVEIFLWVRTIEKKCSLVLLIFWEKDLGRLIKSSLESCRWGVLVDFSVRFI